MKVVSVVVGFILGVLTSAIWQLLHKEDPYSILAEYVQYLIVLRQKSDETKSRLISARSRQEIMDEYMAKMPPYSDTSYLRFSAEMAKRHLADLSRVVDEHERRYLNGVIIPDQMDRVLTVSQNFDHKLAAIVQFTESILDGMQKASKAEAVLNKN